jgi:hypothetical protein
MAETLQREGTWEVSDAFVLPNIEGVVADAELHRESTESVGASYDTADLDLVAHGITLRRHDDGDRCRWRLAMPTGAPSIELTSTSSRVARAELTRVLMAVTSGKDLGDVVSVRTARQLYRISRREDEDSYAVLVDDRVFASTADRLAVWREVEVGVGRGIEHVLPALRMTHAPPAQRAVAGYLNDQIDAVVSGDIGLRRGFDPIHDTRVAIRRIRSTLRVFAKLFEGAAAAELESELKWFAALLGEVRDWQVQRERFSKALNGLPDELTLGPVRSSIRNTLLGVERPARRRVSDAMDSPRYLPLMAVLRQWRTEPPTNDWLGEDDLRTHCRKAQRKPIGACSSRSGATTRRHCTRQGRQLSGPATRPSCSVPCGRRAAGRPRGTQSYRAFSATIKTRWWRGTCCAGWRPEQARRRTRTASPSACYMPTSNESRTKHVRRQPNWQRRDASEQRIGRQADRHNCDQRRRATRARRTARCTAASGRRNRAVVARVGDHRRT